MLGIRFRVHPVSGFGAWSEQGNACLSVSNPVKFGRFSVLRFSRKNKSCQGSKGFLIACKASWGSSSNGQSGYRDEHQDEFLEAFVLTSETIRHHHLRKKGFIEETQWRSSGQLLPFPFQLKDSKADASSFGHGFLRRFQSPTIFLKIACDGDLLLPIVVGEFAIEKLIDALREDETGGFPNQFQFVKSLIGTLGYEVRLVRITERVVNTYYARIDLGKPGEEAMFSVDARPSDAINVAKRCKAPIYVSKQIVLTDAIKIAYGKWRGNDAKTVYDVSLDSAIEGPDPLSEELDLVRKMDMAVVEERYQEAALWRDRLNKLRMSRHEI